MSFTPPDSYSRDISSLQCGLGLRAGGEGRGGGALTTTQHFVTYAKVQTRKRRPFFFSFLPLGSYNRPVNNLGNAYITPFDS